MAKSIVAVFPSHSDAQNAVQELLDQHIAPEHISLVAGSTEAPQEPEQLQVHAGSRNVPQESGETDELGAGEVAGALAGGSLIAIAGLSSVLVPGIGVVLAAGPAAAALGMGATADEDSRANVEIHHVLQHAGLMEAQAQAYTENVRTGQALVAVQAEDDQTDLVADILRNHQGFKLDLRRRDD